MRSLSDTWHGRCSYDRSGPENSFVANLLQVGATIVGAIHGRSTLRIDRGSLLAASIDGDRDGSAVSFIKRHGASAHPVRASAIEYIGALDAEENEIAGTWHIGTRWSGRFIMLRDNRCAFAAQRETAAPGRELVPTK